MNSGENKEETYDQAKAGHAIMERRLKMLSRKSYLTASEELEVKVLKKKKLYYKDIMDTINSIESKKE
jgi:hypothetical protein